MRAKISNNLLCSLCRTTLVIMSNLFPTLGYCKPFFSFFSPDPACCWLNSCLQPWCWNITENYFIILKLVNKETLRNHLNHRTMLYEELLTSLTQARSIAVRLSPVIQGMRDEGWGMFQSTFQFKVSTSLFPGWDSFFTLADLHTSLSACFFRTCTNASAAEACLERI